MMRRAVSFKQTVGRKSHSGEQRRSRVVSKVREMALFLKGQR